MYTSPSSDELLEGVIISLQNDILPNVTSERAGVTVLMMQALLQCVRQRLPVEQQIMAAEHNQMVDLFREVGQLINGSGAPEAARIKERASAESARAELTPPPSFEDLTSAYKALSQSVVDTIDDLDPLLSAGDEGAERAMQRIRAYLAERTATDFATLVVGAGMAGRG